MNEAQKRANKERQRALVDAAKRDETPIERPAPLASFDGVVEIARERTLGAIGVAPDVASIPISRLRFMDRTFQVVGMQSGELLQAKAEPNGREHRIELLPGVNCFLVTYLDPAARKVEFDFVERSSVRTWQIALPAASASAV